MSTTPSRGAPKSNVNSKPAIPINEQNFIRVTYAITRKISIIIIITFFFQMNRGVLNFGKFQQNVRKWICMESCGTRVIAYLTFN